MKLIRAARLAGVATLIASLYTFIFLQPAYLLMSDWPGRQSWFRENTGAWALGGWLWLLAIFAWMILLITFMYTYTPMHRVSTNLQSGLILIAAILLIVGVLVGMNLLPDAADIEWQQFISHTALVLLSAGLFMGGGVTAWIGYDLVQLGKLPWLWMLPGIVAGVAVMPSPFLLPSPFHLLLALIGFLIWCAVFGGRRSLPAAYPEMGASF